MSADNYLYVGRLDDGTFGVFDRCASCYYADEGANVENIRESVNCNAAVTGFSYDVDESWIVHDNKPFRTFATAAEAVEFAHREEREHYYEYGVSVGEGVYESSAPGTGAPSDSSGENDRG